MNLLLALTGVSVLLVIALVCLISYVKQKAALKREVNRLTLTYSSIINVDNEVQRRKEEVSGLQQQISGLQEDYRSQKETLATDYQAKRQLYEALLKEVAVVEDSLEDISYGLYNPHYNFASSERYKTELEAIRSAEKKAIKDNTAVHCRTTWTVQGSAAQGEKMTKMYSRLMLRAFNGECDAAIARVSWNNIMNMQTRIEKSFDAINKLGEVHQISITYDYRNMKLAELRLEFELQEKLHQEKEEQRMIREQMREEERAQREAELAQKKAADEEARYLKALEKARLDVQRVTGKQLESLTGKIQELEQLLVAAQAMKDRAMSMAQLTKSGHVYVISNIGSFGEDVYKIGMTRRLEPMDRVRELGDASVPFGFDVHAMIYSDNAPELENQLHKKLSDSRLNLINNRREFFNVKIDYLEELLKEMGKELQLTKLAEAKEYRESVSIRETKAKVVVEEAVDIVNQFPVKLFDSYDEIANYPEKVSTVPESNQL